MIQKSIQQKLIGFSSFVSVGTRGNEEWGRGWVGRDVWVDKVMQFGCLGFGADKREWQVEQAELC